MATTTTIDNITDEQLRTLRSEAASAGDYMQVAVAELAMAHRNGGNNTTDPDEYQLLDDDEREELREMSTLDALRSCVEAIRDAEAQSDEASA